MTTAEHECGTALDDWPQQVRIVGDVVFEVGVLDEQYVPARGSEPLTDRMSLAVRAILIEDLHLPVAGARVACGE